jgi:CRISPR-associated protein Csx10
MDAGETTNSGGAVDQGPGTFTISLFMISDWRIGTGTGIPGYADRLVQRDIDEVPEDSYGTSQQDRGESGRPGRGADDAQRHAFGGSEDGVRAPGAPIVPAKTLVGVWRDSCEMVAHALDGGPGGVWHDWVTFLFGGQYEPREMAGDVRSDDAGTAADGVITGAGPGPRSGVSPIGARGGDIDALDHADRHLSPLRPATLLVDGPLRLPGRLRRLLHRRPRVAWATTFRKPGVAIDPRTGTAEEKKLRFEETARGGVTLVGTGRIDGFADLDPARQEVAVALLGAGARLLETIGGGRRRGSGRCRMTVEGPGFAPKWTLPPMGEVPPPPEPSPHVIPERPEPVPAPDRAAGWECADLDFIVRQPVLVAATVIGNVVHGATHIPGWCLMPEVARRLGGPAHALVRSGDLVVTAAYPMVGDAGTLPVPRVLVHAKRDRTKVVGNRMVEPDLPPGEARTSDGPADRPASECAGGLEPHGGGSEVVPAATGRDARDNDTGMGQEEGRKPYRDGYVVPDGPRALTIAAPETTVRMHNTVRDDVQRPTRDVGGVYTYRALAAGTRLRAQVRVRSGALAQGWEQRLSGPWRIGRSAKDDYGQVDAEARRRVPTEPAVRTRTAVPASGPARPSAGPEAPERLADPITASGGDGERLLRVWLLSDLLVRDRRLRPSTDLDDVGRALEKALAAAGAPDVRLRPAPRVDPRRGTVNVTCDTRRTESWHRRWGLPRPTLYGLAAGSCLTFEVTDGLIDPSALTEVRLGGIGERRAEGFGQVEFDHPLLLRPVASPLPSAGPVPLPTPGSTGESPSGSNARVRPVAYRYGEGDRPLGETGHIVSTADPVGPCREGDDDLLEPGETGHAEARVFERAAWRAEIHRAAERIAADPTARSALIPGEVSVTRLNALREITRETSVAAARHRLGLLTKSQAGRPDWPRQDSIKGVESLLTEPDRIWGLLNLPEPELALTRDGIASLRVGLRAEAVRTLIDACLAAHSRARAMKGTTS